MKEQLDGQKIGDKVIVKHAGERALSIRIQVTPTQKVAVLKLF